MQRHLVGVAISRLCSVIYTLFIYGFLSNRLAMKYVKVFVFFLICIVIQVPFCVQYLNLANTNNLHQPCFFLTYQVFRMRSNSFFRASPLGRRYYSYFTKARWQGLCLAKIDSTLLNLGLIPLHYTLLRPIRMVLKSCLDRGPILQLTAERFLF